MNLRSKANHKQYSQLMLLTYLFEFRSTGGCRQKLGIGQRPSMGRGPGYEGRCAGLQWLQSWAKRRFSVKEGTGHQHREPGSCTGNFCTRFKDRTNL